MTGFAGAGNLQGMFWYTREALKIMEPNMYGRVVNVASTGETSVMSGHSPGYSASKAAVVSLTKTVALDFAGTNILVNCIAPGGIRTADFDAYMKKVGASGRVRFTGSFGSAGSANQENMRPADRRL
jgi:3-oxoacyl-[acyl-carrier protein] reductase